MGKFCLHISVLEDASDSMRGRHHHCYVDLGGLCRVVLYLPLFPASSILTRHDVSVKTIRGTRAPNPTERAGYTPDLEIYAPGHTRKGAGKAAGTPLPASMHTCAAQHEKRRRFSVRGG